MIKKSITIVLVASAFATVTAMSSVRELPHIPELVATTTVPLPWATRAYNFIKTLFVPRSVVPRHVFSQQAVVEIDAFKNSLKGQKLVDNSFRPARNLLITGEPAILESILETLPSQFFANDLDMYYAVVHARDLTEDSGDTLLETLAKIRHLFGWINSQSKPVCLIIDEAEMIFARRYSQTTARCSRVFSAMMQHLGTHYKNFSVIALTTYPQRLDEPIRACFTLQITL